MTRIINPTIFAGGEVDLTANLLHWWDLDDDGTWADDPGTWDLTENGTVTNTTNAPDSGDSADFTDGSTAYLDLSQRAWDGAGAARSIGLWFMIPTSTSGSRWLYSHREPDPPALHQIAIVNGVVYFDVWNSSGTLSDTNAAISADTWYSVLGVTDGSSDHRLYLDGTEADTDTTSLGGTITTNSCKFAISTQSWAKGTGSAQGYIASCAVWDSMLDADQATAFHNSGSNLRHADL